MTKEHKMDYPYIRAWGRMMGSHAYYIDSQVQQARQDKAPADATYKNSEGKWKTFADVTNASTRENLNNIINGVSP